MKKTTKSLLLLVFVILVYAVWPNVPSMAMNSSTLKPNEPSANMEGYVPGEVLAPAESWRQAQEIAEAYNLILKSYAYGIAVLAAPDALEAVEQSIAAQSISPQRTNKDHNQSQEYQNLPILSLNLLYQTSDIAYDNSSKPANYTSYRADVKYSGYSALGYAGSPYTFERPSPLNGLATYGVADTRPSLELNSLPGGSSQWHHQAMYSEQAWNISSGKNVVVAVIDTGIDISHPDFAGRISKLSYNSYTGQVGIAHVDDDLGHGTHVSGIIASALNEDEGICGLAFDAQIMMIKANVPEAPNFFDLASLIQGINYAVEYGADIINMSLGRMYDEEWGVDELEHKAIKDAVSAGVTIICAAGNESYCHAGYPAAYPETIAVSAINWDCEFETYYSNYGPEIDIAAPGGDIYSTYIGGGYDYLSGTSMASPCVAGVAALIKSLHDDYTPQQIKEVLCQTARDNGQLGRDDYYGYGVVNAYGAVLGSDALYNITFDFNDGLRDPVTVKSAPGCYLLNPDNPFLQGFAFNGWYVSGNGRRFNNREAINVDIDLYAQWIIPQAGMYIVEFPDYNFRREVLRILNYDGGLRVDGSIISIDDKAELASYTGVYLSYMGINDLTGIKYYSNLESLWCSENQLAELDLSSNTALKMLDCSDNNLSELDVSKNTGLYWLNCARNDFISLDFSGCQALETLFVTQNYQLQNLNVSNNTALRELYCSYCQLTGLNVKSNIALEILGCAGNLLTELDITHNTNLCGYNNDIFVYPGLDCSENQLTELDVSKNSDLSILICHSNNLSALDVSQNKELTELYCGHNQLSWIDVSKNTELTILGCSYNNIVDLDLYNNTKLTLLSCEQNNLTSLSLKQNNALSLVNCANNFLTALDLSNKELLVGLNCDNNLLTKLNVANTELSQTYGVLYISGYELFSPGLNCYNNFLNTLDVSGNSELSMLDCRYNKLITVDDVYGWREIGLILEENFFFDPQKGNLEPGVFIEEFPDANFCQAVLDLLNEDGGNRTFASVMSWNDLATMATRSYLWLDSMDIADLTGIKYFSSLQYLGCFANQLTELDISNNTELLWLDCGYNQLNDLNLLNNLKLEFLYCYDSQLTELDVSNNLKLEFLSCDYNQLTSLDASNNTNLQYLNCSYNLLPFPEAVSGWQQLGLIINSPEDMYSGTFIYYPQKNGGEDSMVYGTLLFQASTRPTIIELFNSAGQLIHSESIAISGAFALTVPSGAGYTLKVSKPGYLSYTIKNLNLAEWYDIGEIDIRQMAGDIDGNGVVNATDLTYLLSEFNRNPVNSNYPYADIDGNGVVNATDLTYLLAGFNKHDIVAIND